MMFFVTAIAGSAVARRVRASEAKAQKVGSEFADLSRLNEIVLDTMQTGVLVVDADNAIRLMNTAAARLIADTEPSIGIALSSLSPALTEALSRWREGRAAPESAIVPAHPGSSELLPRFRRLGAWADSPVLILLEDAARIRDQAQQIKLAALGRLSASIAHEIRNPLSAITHAGQLLAESPDLATQDRRLLDIVQRHGKRIDTIVKDVLNLSRAAAEPRDFLLLPWMQRTAQLYAEAHPGRNLTVTGEPGLQARFDPGHLQQVVFNLLDNAWLHGSRDGQPPEVHMQCRSLYLQGGALQVSDNGPGVAPETQEHLFEPFQTTSAQGTGLGLYLARELCAYNQGKLTYHAVPEGGAMFRITLIAPDATPMPKDD
jgi:two-component system sensor histidine kinase PilS (NtrC family)